ncbi:MAG: hypothetical protein DCC43_14355 [Candidatus Brocadia sp.]|nr:hypothetical protein [Candidatus Brocadia fulgida]MCE7912913.1 hypothetical protein [Candidatus Brocadia sp. AMX3]RIJ91219.1 MAG: hypothetical protein DCC43_14355 [Candidatus Brocadia sp.]
MLIHNSWDGYAAIKSPFVMGEGGCKKIYLNAFVLGNTMKGGILQQIQRTVFMAGGLMTIGCGTLDRAKMSNLNLICQNVSSKEILAKVVVRQSKKTP